jgi:UDP-glucuronate decarboxylase
MAGEPLTIYGDGRQTRSLCYVDDMVEGLIRLMEVEPAPDGPVNLGNPIEMRVRDIADMIEYACSAKSLGRHLLPLPADDPRQRCPDISRAKSLLNWGPKTSFEEGLVKTIAWLYHQQMEPNCEKA